MASRLATADDLDGVTETITLAFMQDPVWSWAFPQEHLREQQYLAWWRLFAAAAATNGSLWIAEEASAAAIWVSPGASEMLPDDEARVEPLLRQLLGSRQAALVAELNGRFDEHHPSESFHYLSLLGTHPDQRGHGLGMGLLADRLTELDALGEPSLLESTNPVNHERYARLGYRRIDEWRAPDGGPPVAVMWRDPS
jgi:GNAT superfamily N-acetyltransferase